MATIDRLGTHLKLGASILIMGLSECNRSLLYGYLQISIVCRRLLDFVALLCISCFLCFMGIK